MEYMSQGGSGKFQSTPSVWRETIMGAKNKAHTHDFNPLPPCGGRHFYGL
mgnify:CR=1 FL=1